MINPAQSSLMYVATATHGLYVSQNAQSTTPTFSELATVFPARASRVFSVHPVSQWEMYVGTDGNGLRYGAHQIPSIPVLNRVNPERDTVIEHKKGVRPTLSIVPTFSTRQSMTKAQARFSKTKTFVLADTTDIMNPMSNHFPLSIIGGDEIIFMQCRIGNNTGWSSWSEAIQISFKETNVSFIEEEQVLKEVVPHPAQQTLTIQRSLNQPMYLYTVSGAFIMSGMTNTPLDISSLPSGMYIVRLNDDEMIRFIKQ
jgi:hypothetical protein